jgi:RNA polymerase sigma-70 factor, ECF subfamily
MGEVQEARAVVEARTEIERVYREDGARLQRALLLFTGDREVAEDAVAEAFAQALRRGTAIKAVAPWVWRAAFRIAAGELTRRGSARAEATEGSYVLPETVVDLVRALRRLSPKQRGSVVLHHLAGYRAKEIAEILGSTAPAVMVHLSAGRKRLRALLAEGELDG